MSELEFRERRGREPVHLSVTPLIDVLFLLIIFFMLTGTFRRFGELELRLPESTTAGNQEEVASTVELVATVDGRTLVDGEAVDEGALADRLRALQEADPTREVLLRAETDVPHGRVVTLLDAVRDAGFRGVGIGTEISPE